MAVSPKEKPSRLELNRAGFAKYKDDVKKRGKPFYPYAMFHDTVMSLVVVLVIIGLAVIWKWTAYGPHHNCADSGILGPCMGAPADPGTTSFVPRPDWYFYFLFYLLRIFKWPESVFLGTVGVPTIATGRCESFRVRRRSMNGSMIRRTRAMFGTPTVPRKTVFGHLKTRSR